MVILIASMSLISTMSVAQERTDNQLFIFEVPEEKSGMIEVDTTLFRLPITHSLDPYSQATQYYGVQGSSRRRGLYYTTAQQIVEPAKSYLLALDEPIEQTQVTLYSVQSRYRIALRANHAQSIFSNWILSASLWMQTGRDMFVEGLFSNTISPEIQLSKSFDYNHFLKINFASRHSMQGLQYGSTPEAFELIGSNYYNPSWGFYNGEVRNSRVRRDATPSLELHYQQPISPISTFVVEGEASYSRRANSSLGWYNATTPSPDYYRKMPSYMPAGEVQDYVRELWLLNNSDYTQINWDEMVMLNSVSADGNAFYVVEDRVNRTIEGKATAVIRTTVQERLTLTYGVESQWSTTRNFKEMKDLLGASYLIDYDTFMGDNYNKTMPLQNDLLNPDRKIYEGDRFGYDYSIVNSKMSGILRAQYRASRLDFDLEATISEESLYRTGHYEKERFDGAASLGNSSVINEAPYIIRATVGYAVQANKYFALKLVSSRLSPLSSNLFLNETVANYLSNSTSGEMINSASLAFRFNYPSITLSGELYALRSRDGSSVYSLYDDLTSTMCRASITGVGYCSYGTEVVADIRLHHDLRLSATVAAGRYLYDIDPYVELLDDFDLTTISSPTSSRMSGVNIGNTPQVSTTLSASYFGFSRVILNFSTSYAALRYEQPSIVRRSERLLSQAFLNAESAESALVQQRLGDIFDIEISASRFFWLEQGGRISVRASIKNLLGDNDRVYYAKESDRIMLQSIDGYFAGATMREGIYQYGTPRTMSLSVSYLF